MKKVLIFNENRYFEYALEDTLIINDLNLTNDGQNCRINEDVIKENEIVTINNTSILIIDNYKQKYKVTHWPVIIGPDEDLTLKNSKLVLNNNQILNDNHETIYINGIQSNDSLIDIKHGDNVLIDNYLIIIHLDSIDIYGNQNYQTNLAKVKDKSEKTEYFPDYKSHLV
ncbi:MAG: hypothetical protein PHH04_03765 [Thomasclavelia sp.]|nr:hypothetical protein [Thomasclavelia sp.]